MKKPAIFLDRDGTINEIVVNDDTGQPDSPLKPAELRLLPGAADAIKLLRSLGYIVIVITNQPAAAKGKTTLGDLHAINDRLRDILAAEQTNVDDILMCPHHPVGAPGSRERFLICECDCRKPRPGLLIKAIEKFNIDLESSYMVGDSFSDILAGKKLGVKGIFIGHFKCDSCRLLDGQKPDGVFKSVYDFALSLNAGK